MGLNRKVRNGYRQSGPMQKGERLCEYTITVSLKDLEKLKESAPPAGYPPQQVHVSEIVHKFPEADHPDFAFDPAVRIFAHPSDLRFFPGTRNPHVHTFVSTKVDGAKLYGFCYTRYRRLKKEDEGAFPEVLCVISRFPYIEFIEDLIKKYPFKSFESTEGIDNATNMDVYTYLNSTDSPVTVGSLSDELPFVNVDFKHLFVHLHPTNVLKILNAIMCERKILFIASASILVRCIEAFMSLVAPFEWPNVYIPIIPSIIQKGQDMSQILIETCFMPFIVGVSKESMEYKDPPRPPKDVVVVDIERDNVMLGDEEIIPFPPKHRKILLDAANDYAVTVLYPEVPQDEESEKIDKLVLELALPDSVYEAPVQPKEVDSGLYNMVKTAERGWMLQLKGENVGTDVLAMRKTDHASQLRKRCLIVWAAIFRHYKEYINVPTEEQMNNPKFEFFRNEEFMGSIPESNQQFVSHFVKGQMWSWFLQDYCFKSEESAFDQRAYEARKIANEVLESQRFHDILWPMPCSVAGGEKIMYLVEMSNNQLNFWSLNETSEADYMANPDDPSLMELAHAIVIKADTVLSVSLERRDGFPLSVGAGEEQVALHAESSLARRSLLEGIRCVMLRARKNANKKERGLNHSLSMHMGSMLKKTRTRAATTDLIFSVSKEGNEQVKTPASHALPDFRTPSSPPSPRLLFQEYKRQQMQQELEYNEEIARKESLLGAGGHHSPATHKGTLGRKINRLFGSPSSTSDGDGSSSPSTKPKRPAKKEKAEKMDKQDKGWRIGTNRGKVDRNSSSDYVSVESDPEAAQYRQEGNERNEEVKTIATEIALSASKMAAQDSKFLDAILKSFLQCIESNNIDEKSVLDGIHVDDSGDPDAEYQSSISISLLEIQRKSLDLLNKINKSPKDQAEKSLSHLRQIAKTLKQSTVF
eukprot:TRINITY_DN1769_c0_g1_i1.p1 TRINITY_DN1769_c0_g1~~TRINITY_DN1769_c0_g1_i1.p1  ORF type:complete len:927 (-),score=289.41 TRINITY_DN1769_c0_g1_i1:103-2883(-)